MTAPAERGGIMSAAYTARDFDAGPRTYSDESFMDTIHAATGLGEFAGPAVVIDLMSGPAKVAQGLRKRSPQHRYIAVDASSGQLEKVPDGIERFQADVRDMGDVPLADVVVVRYGLKDIPQHQQPAVLANIHRILKPGGVLVVVDMVSPDGMKFRTNKQHSLKQELGIVPRDIAAEGRCHIPTEDGWHDLLENAGFQVQSREDYVSQVATTDWVKGKQIGEIQRGQMDALLASEPPYFRQRFNIRGKKPLRIDFPVVVIKAVKPIVPAARELVVYGGDSTVRYRRPNDESNNYLVDSSATFRK